MSFTSVIQSVTAMGAATMADAIDYFSDPLDPSRSIQLNNRMWKGDTFKHLDLLREADDDLNHRRIGSLRKSLRRIKALLPAQYYGALVRRIVYSMLYHVSFEPIRFSIKLSDAFVRANSYIGPKNEAYQSAQHTEELRHIVGLARRVYQDYYGNDLMFSHFQIRYINSTNSQRVREITKYGAFSDFHLDQLMGFTSIIYLCAVGRDNGCFSYIDGTSRMKRSHLLRALHQVVTFDMALPLPEQTSHLPLELRGGMGYGNFMDDEKVERLSNARVDFVGNVGDGIMYNGFDTLHRGGKPTTGERTARCIATGRQSRVGAKTYANQPLALLWL